MPKITRIDHIALAVDDTEPALAFWRDALGLELTHIEDVPHQASRVSFLPIKDSEIELVQPTQEDTGLARYLEKRGPGIHHIALEVDDLEGMLAQLKAKGIRLIDEEPNIGAGGTRMAFIHPSAAYGVLVELYEKKRHGPSKLFPLLETPRLHLRAHRLTDMEMVCDLHSYESVTRHLSTDPITQLSDAKELLEKRMSIFERGTGLRWAITLQGDPNTAIGSCGYFFIRRGQPTVELGYELHPNHWNQGYTTEALTAVLNYAFTNKNQPVNRVEAITMLDNAPSERVLANLGFKPEGIRKEYGYWKGEYHDVKSYALLSKDWLASTG